MTQLAALFERPIAHRGLHDAASGVIENSPSAVRAAMERGYAIEVDVQLTHDGDAFVFHDAALERLTHGTGLVNAHTGEALRHIPMRNSTDALWSLSDMLAMVNGTVPLVIEVKSGWNGQQDQLARRVAELVGGYKGLALVKSFDPRVVMLVRKLQPQVLRGIIGCAFKADKDWSFLDAGMRFSARNMLHWPVTRPHALSWDVHDLPRLSVALARRIMHVPVMSWTVRTPQDRARAERYANQIVFEGFCP